ncbi:hypothetical protein AVEN_275588-1 [Araneus ventricosus]|uniref:Uncharacterized protein n=1 Tax=Araneus ventricosus TaxID=182803 RepID=A0A4Y2KCZ8_ARAVE|nr:hypothetical protein AVEN_275588-1 [Araneus ventricosus]
MCFSLHRKLKYLSDVVKKAKDPITGRKSPFQVKETIVQVLVTNPDVTVLSHKPLYGNGELFSYIGGLIGCWLGISVWTLAGIFEKSVARIRRLARKLKRKTKHLQPGEAYI